MILFNPLNKIPSFLFNSLNKKPRGIATARLMSN